MSRHTERYVAGCACPGCAVYRAKKRAYQARRHKLIALHQYSSAYTTTVGSQRRLRALARLGWTMLLVAEHHPDLTRYALQVTLGARRGRITKVKARAIADVYRKLSAHTPPDNRSTRTAKAIAVRKGWAPPAAWDDDTMHWPLVDPNYHGAETRRCPWCKALFTVRQGRWLHCSSQCGRAHSRFTEQNKNTRRVAA